MFIAPPDTETTTDYSAFAPIVDALSVLKKHLPDTTLRRASMFLEVLTNPGCDTRHIMTRFNTAQASVSRNMDALGENGWLSTQTGKRTVGLKLVKVVPDPKDARRYCYFPTAKGKALGKLIEEALSEKAAPEHRS